MDFCVCLWVPPWKGHATIHRALQREPIFLMCSDMPRWDSSVWVWTTGLHSLKYLSFWQNKNGKQLLGSHPRWQRMRSQSVVTLCPLQHPHSEHTEMFHNDWLPSAAVNVPECTYLQDMAQDAWARTWPMFITSMVPFYQCALIAIKGFREKNEQWLLLTFVIILQACQVVSLTLPFIRQELGSGCKTMSCIQKVHEVLWTSGKLWQKRVNMRTGWLILISCICCWHWL